MRQKYPLALENLNIIFENNYEISDRKFLQTYYTLQTKFKPGRYKPQTKLYLWDTLCTFLK